MYDKINFEISASYSDIDNTISFNEIVDVMGVDHNSNWKNILDLWQLRHMV